MTRWGSVCVGLLVLLMVGAPLTVEGQNHPLKYFRLFLKNTLTAEIQSCFARDWSMTDITSVSDVFDSYKDRQNFVFGFDGETDFEMHDCSGTTGFDLDLTVWDCAVDIIRNADAQGQAIWEMKLDMALCDHNTQTGLVPDNEILVRFFDDREYGKTELSVNHFNIQFERITPAGGFRDMIRYESNYSARFGPPNFDPNLMEVNLNFRRNGALDFEVQSNIPVTNTFNYCVDAQRCLEAIYAGMDVPPWICPQDTCPPGYRHYKEDLCYLSMVTEQIFGGGGANSYRMQVPGYNTTFRRIRGTRDCLDRQVDPTWCYNRVRTLVGDCFRYTQQNYAYSAP